MNDKYAQYIPLDIKNPIKNTPLIIPLIALQYGTFNIKSTLTIENNYTS